MARPDLLDSVAPWAPWERWGYTPSELRHLGGTLFVLLMLPVSFTQIAQHLRNFRSPAEQRALVRIIAMVPLFGVVSLVSLNFDNLALYIQMLRESYEAFAIYCFLKYLISYLGDDEVLGARLADKSARIGVHKPPFCCLPPWTMGDDFLLNCKLGALQYVVVRTLASLAACALHFFGVYTEGLMHPRHAYFWLTLANCVSQTWALYTLVLFYHATYKDLLHIHPFSKFLCIKGVVFFSWWQGLVIHVMVHQGLIVDTAFKRKERIAKGIQDTLVCIEMLIASFAFYVCFPASDYSGHAQKGMSKRSLSYHSGLQTAASEDSLAPSPNSIEKEGHLAHRVTGSGSSGGASEFKADLGRKKSSGSGAGGEAATDKEADKTRMPVWRAFLWVIFPVDVRADILSVIAKKAQRRTRCCKAAPKVVGLTAVTKKASNRALV